MLKEKRKKYKYIDITKLLLKYKIIFLTMNDEEKNNTTY